ncbi:MAG: hypothetical protein ACRDZ2_11900 [Ilumatobacteraceae bacterium]
MGRPVLLVVDGGPGALAGVGREVGERYGLQYDVVYLSSPQEAKAHRGGRRVR